jgi:hypothetical protein
MELAGGGDSGIKEAEADKPDKQASNVYYVYRT